jgi:hypothetical protein
MLSKKIENKILSILLNLFSLAFVIVLLIDLYILYIK